jgi:hypothetical protein
VKTIFVAEFNVNATEIPFALIFLFLFDIQLVISKILLIAFDLIRRTSSYVLVIPSN